MSGLLKGGTYHARLVARNDDGLSLGADVSFTGAGLDPAANAPAPPPGGDTGSGARSRLGPGLRQDPGNDPGARPRPRRSPRPRRPSSARRLGAAPQAGSVLVRLPGSTRAVALTDAASIPVGSIVDARKGTVALSSALPGDDTQTGTFHGGLFEVRQPAGARGMTELVLRGPLPTCTGGRRPRRGRFGQAPAARAVGPRRSRALPHARQQQRRHRPRHRVVRRGPLRRHADARQQGQRLGARPAPPAHRHRRCRQELPRAQRRADPMTARARHCVFAALVALGAARRRHRRRATAGGGAPDVQTQAPTSIAQHLGRPPRPRQSRAPGRPPTGSRSARRSPTAPRPTPRAPARATSPSPSPRASATSSRRRRTTCASWPPTTAASAQGADVTFTTSAASGQPSAAPLPAPAAPSPLPGTELAPAPAAPPVLGRSVTLAPAERHGPRARAGGDQPGGARRRRLGAGRLDHRHPRRHRRSCRARCRAAAPRPGTFHGGLFEVRQPAGGHGMTELVLRGALPTCPAGARARRRGQRAGARRARCGATTATATSARAASNSVITVRGTTWFVSDRCDGTLTRVTQRQRGRPRPAHRPHGRRPRRSAPPRAPGGLSGGRARAQARLRARRHRGRGRPGRHRRRRRGGVRAPAARPRAGLGQPALRAPRRGVRAGAAGRGHRRQDLRRPRAVLAVPALAPRAGHRPPAPRRRRAPSSTTSSSPSRPRRARTTR